MNCYFTMTKAHTALADDVGYSRFVDAVRNGRAHVGHLPRDDAIWSYVRGCRFELAFYLWLGGDLAGVKWNDFFLNATTEQLSRPDIEYRGRSIDIKLRPKGWDDFIIRRQSLKANVNYVLASDDNYPCCVFHGWMAGSVVATCQLGGRSEIPGHIIRMDHPDLKDCMMLKDDRYDIPWVSPIYAGAYGAQHGMTDAERAGHPNGFVGYDKDGHFVHYCHCGKEAGHGHDYFPRQGKLGVWFCSDHNPKEPASPIQPPVAATAPSAGSKPRVVLYEDDRRAFEDWTAGRRREQW